jgi:hypothetical protein
VVVVPAETVPLPVSVIVVNGPLGESGVSTETETATRQRQRHRQRQRPVLVLVLALILEPRKEYQSQLLDFLPINRIIIIAHLAV